MFRKLFTLILCCSASAVVFAQSKPKIEIYLPDKIYYPLAGANGNGSFFYCDASALPTIPFIADGEIKGYEIIGDSTMRNSPLYRLKIDLEGQRKVRGLIAKGIPLLGKPFVITIDRQPIYSGYFWNVVSSFGSTWIIITASSSSIWRIDRGLPFSNFDANHADPRGDPRLLDAFKATKRLIITNN